MLLTPEGEIKGVESALVCHKSKIFEMEAVGTDQGNESIVASGGQNRLIFLLGWTVWILIVENVAIVAMLAAPNLYHFGAEDRVIFL